jgi:hypothetical protein
MHLNEKKTTFKVTKVLPYQINSIFFLRFADRPSQYNLSQWPTWCTNFNTFITILYMYMFRAISCSSSGGQIVLIQHLVSSLSVSDRPVNWLREIWLEPEPVFSLSLSLSLRMDSKVRCTGWKRTGSTQFSLNLCTGRSLTDSDDTRCCINTIWPLTSSLSTCAPDSHLLTVTIPDAVLIQFDLLRMSKILLETCRGL